MKLHLDSKSKSELGMLILKRVSVLKVLRNSKQANVRLDRLGKKLALKMKNLSEKSEKILSGTERVNLSLHVLVLQMLQAQRE